MQGSVLSSQNIMNQIPTLIWDLAIVCNGLRDLEVRAAVKLHHHNYIVKSKEALEHALEVEAARHYIRQTHKLRKV